MAAEMGQIESAVVAGNSDRSPSRQRNFFVYLPGFTYILILYVVGAWVFPDPRATLFDVLGYQLAWVEVLLAAAAVVAMAEQLKVASPGINNTSEVLFMGAIAIVQLLLFTLAAARVEALSMFNNTEFLLLTVINLAQTAVAYQINSATLMRTISSS